MKKILSGTQVSLVEEIVQIGQQSDREADEKLAAQVTEDVLAMGDREEAIADLKARIEAGTYNPTGDEIADAMIRRSIADRIR
ncbi:MAG: flagellar biosynthesis anti-sigma factor FlgM [Fimbriimonadaceae bacterium]|nr:flagellar biosynthesis anti-sigma factor FlgM [Fimbriimonadaceae bacterium]